jgi:GrpB-like predicted nucleotidyltransferase (UPF0157 family)
MVGAIVRPVSWVDEPITVEAYSSEWPTQFEKEAARLGEGFDDSVLAIEHIGSTAVVDVASKPVIDLMIGVSDLDTTEALADRLTALGYEDCGGAVGRRYFRKRGGGQNFNVQVMEYASPKWSANLLFRDYLGSDADAAQQYSEAKRAAATRAPTLLAYSMLKKPIIEELLRRARANSRQ